MLTIQKHLMVECKCENSIFIADLEGLSVLNFANPLMAQIVRKILQIGRGRCRSFFVLNVPTAFSVLWSMVQPFLDESMKAKVVITRDRTHENLKAMIADSQLESRYGGTMGDF